MLTIRGRQTKDYTCLSTDNKPTNAANGALLLEIDTGKIYAYNEAGETWVEI